MAKVKGRSRARKAPATPRTTPQDDIYALIQTRTVRDVARLLKVDRRTVQRWKNQGQQPKQDTRARLYKAASRDRSEIRAEGKRSGERWKEPASLPVPLMGKRQYVTEEIKPSRKQKENRAAWEKEKQRSKEKGRVHDRFYSVKDKKTGRTRYYRAQDGGAVVFDARRARDVDIAAMVAAYRGQKLGIVLVHVLTKEYKMKDGTVLPKGAHLGSRPESLDQAQFATPEGIKKFIDERKRKGRLAFIRITGL